MNTKAGEGSGAAPTLADALKQCSDAVTQMIACHDEPECPALETARAALAAAKPLTPRDVARQVFALCEQFEDLQDSPADSFGLQRHIAGQRFAAKRIRNAIGDWLTEQERAHNIKGRTT